MSDLPLPSWLDDPPLIVVLAIVFAVLLTLALIVVIPTMYLAQKRRRLVQIEAYRTAEVQKRLRESIPPGGALTSGALALTERFVRSGGLEARFAAQLDRAGMSLRPHEWVLIRIVVAAAVSLVLGLVLGVLGAIFGLGFGWFATALYHRRRARLREEKFASQLPEALQMVIGSLRSGFSLPQALDAMLREAEEPLAGEFNRALAETKLGMPLETALDRLATRADNLDLAWTVMAIRVQREVGGNLAEVLGSTVDTVRSRERLQGEVRSLSAEGRISGWILLGLPIAVGLLMFTTRYEYVSPLVTDPRGIFMLLFAITLLCVGGFWMFRLIKVEV